MTNADSRTRGEAVKGIGNEVMVSAARRVAVVCASGLVVADAYAGGLPTQVQSQLSALSTFLSGLGVVIVTIGLLWAGFRMIFQAAKFSEIAHIFIGAVVIGAASGIAAFMVG